VTDAPGSVAILPVRSLRRGATRSLTRQAWLLCGGASVLTVLGSNLPGKFVAGLAAGIVAIVCTTQWPMHAIAAIPLLATIVDGRLQPPVRVGSLVLVIAASTLVFRRARIVRSATIITGLLFVWVTANFVFVAIPLGTPSSFRELLVVLEGLVLCAVAASVGVSLPVLLRVLTVLGPAVTFFTFFPATRIGGRAGALGLNPNSLGILLAVGATAAVLDFRRTRAPFAFLCGIGALAGLPQVQSRGSVVALGVGLASACIVGRRLLPALRLTLLAVVVVSAVPVLSDAAKLATSNRDTQETQSSTLYRAQAARVSLDAAGHNLLTGVGFGRASVIAAADPRTQQVIVPHNGYLSVASELGLPALLGMLVLMAVPPLLSFGEKRRRPDVVYLAPITLTLMVGALFMTLFDSAPMVAPLWVTVGASWYLFTRRDPLDQVPTKPESIVL
jgi:O-Antigen ligase